MSSLLFVPLKPLKRLTTLSLFWQAGRCLALLAQSKEAAPSSPLLKTPPGAYILDAASAHLLCVCLLHMCFFISFCFIVYGLERISMQAMHTTLFKVSKPSSL
jgi:hypothetical protein